MKKFKTNNTFFYVIANMLKRYKEHEVGATGASLAYFFILSIFPFLIFLNALISLINLSPEFISGNFSTVLPQEVVEIINYYLDYIKKSPSKGLFSFGIITTIFTASKAFSGVLTALNKAYKNTVKSGIHHMFISIVGTVIFGISILVSIIIISIGNDFWIFLSNYFNLPSFFMKSWDYLKWLIVFISLFFSLGFIHYIIPNEKIKFKQTIPGTVFSISMWLIISYAFTYYVKNFGSYSAVYGPLGAIIILLLWLYLTGVIMVMGGELNHILIEKKLSK